MVHGPSGYGKTTIMAAAAYRLREENPGIEITIIMRFLNLTPHSSTIFHTLRSITEQVSSHNNMVPIQCVSSSPVHLQCNLSNNLLFHLEFLNCIFV